MDYKFLSRLDKGQLEQFRNILCDDESRQDLIDYVNKKISIIKDVSRVNFSSDRMPYHKEENENGCLQLLQQLSVADFKFLQDTFSVSGANRKCDLDWGKVVGIQTVSFGVPGLLSTLEEFYKDPKNVYDYEGVYNTLNYIKNYIYYCLDEKSSIDIFEDYDEKVKLVTERFPAIAKYLYDIMSGTKLQLSIGNNGLYGAISKDGKSFTNNQYKIVEAVAFGTDLKKLEREDYTDSKRLLFLPRYVGSE